jgi:hypothetical protein
MYTITLKELKAVLKVNTQAGQSGAVNKTSMEWMTQDDYFQQVKRRKRYILTYTSQTAKKSTKPVPTSTAVKPPPKAVLTRNFFEPLRTIDMNTKITDAQRTHYRSSSLPENHVGSHK